MALLLALVLWLVARGSAEQDDVVWHRVQETGVWHVGLDPSFPPFEFMDDQGHLAGFDVDLAHAIAAMWGVTVTLHGVGFDSLYDAVMAGRVDSALSALPAEPRFARDVAYSAPYFEAGLLWVHGDDGWRIRRAEDVAGRRVAVERGSEAESFVRRLSRRVTGIELLRFATPAAALAATLDGAADVALVDAISAWQAAAVDGRLQVATAPAEPLPYVLALPVDAPRLNREVNRALAALRENGTLDALHHKWFGVGPVTTVP